MNNNILRSKGSLVASLAIVVILLGLGQPAKALFSSELAAQARVLAAQTYQTTTIYKASNLTLSVTPFDFDPGSGKWNYRVNWNRIAGRSGSIYLNGNLFANNASGIGENFTGFNLNPDSSYRITYYSLPNGGGVRIVNRYFKTLQPEESAPAVENNTLNSTFNSTSNTNPIITGQGTVASSFTSPTVGSSFTMGTTQSVIWKDAYIGKRVSMNIDLIASNGTIKSLAKQIIDTGYYSWTIPNCSLPGTCSSNFEIPAGAYKISITYLKTGTKNLVSPQFNVVAPIRVGQLINNNGTVQLVGNGGVYGIPSLEVFNSWGWSFTQVVPANSAEMALPQIGVVPLKDINCTNPIDQIAGKCGSVTPTSTPASLTATLNSAVASPLPVAAGATSQRVASFKISTNSVSSASLTSARLGITGNSIGSNFQNLRLMVGSVQMGQVQPSVTSNGSYDFYFSSPLVVPAGGALYLDVYVDVLATVNSTNFGVQGQNLVNLTYLSGTYTVNNSDIGRITLVAGQVLTLALPSSLSANFVGGNKTSYNAGENVLLSLRGMESDGTFALPSEGFNVQVYIRGINDGYSIQGKNATFNSSTSNWETQLVMPADASKTYRLDATLYCSNSSLACGSKYGSQGITTTINFTVSGTGRSMVMVTSPNGSETYHPGDNLSLRWTADCGFGSGFKIMLVRGSEVVQTLIESSPQGICSSGQTAIPYTTSWQIPSTLSLGTNYKIFVNGMPGDGAGIGDDSDAYFAISAATQPSTYVKVIYPNGGEVVPYKSRSTISWQTSPDITRIDVALYKLGPNGTFYVSFIRSNLTPAPGSTAGSTTWLPTDYMALASSTGNVFKVSVIGNGGNLEDFSDNFFSVGPVTFSTLLGDVNMDGLVSASDGGAIARYVSSCSANSFYCLSPQALINADVTGGGAVNDIDMEIIYQYYNRLISQFPKVDGSVLVLGDANRDGQITLADADLINMYMNDPDTYPLLGRAMDNSDVDSDGEITPTDVNLISNYTQGLITTFPRGSSVPAKLSTLLGDVYLDNKVTIGDALTVSNYINGSIRLSSQAIINADVTGEGKVNGIDSLIISQYAGLFITQFPKVDGSVLKLGDANRDGSVTSSDADLITTYIGAPANGYLLGRALDNSDVDNDGKITTTDVNLVSNYAKGLITTFPRGGSVSNSTLTASLDGSSPDASLVADNQSKTVAAFKVTSSGGSNTVQEVTINIPDVSSVANVILKDGSTTIGTKPGANTVTFTGLNISVPTGSSGKVLSVDLQLGGVGGGLGTSNSEVTVTLANIKYINSNGVVNNYTNRITAQAQYAFAAVPVFNYGLSLPTNLLQTGADKTLAKFSISAQGGQISWNKVVVNVSKTANVMLNNLYLVDDSNNAKISSIGSTTLSSLGAINNFPLIFALANEQNVSGSKSYSVMGAVSGTFISGDYVLTNIPSGQTAHQASATASNIPQTETFAWSDLSAPSHDVNTLDWYGDFLVRNMPTDNQYLSY